MASRTRYPSAGILTGPRKDTTAIARTRSIVREDTTARQTTLLVRLNGPVEVGRVAGRRNVIRGDGSRVQAVEEATHE
ncbi:MAG TPA: hypothetical protein VFO01_18625 [Trebonia sp.]|nr:hypothetical protein [Trebonia sp.]